MSEHCEIRDLRETDKYFIDNSFIKSGWGKAVGVYGVAVYNVLASFANGKTQQAWPSYAKIANLLGCSRRQVISSVALLEKYNLIRKQARFDEAGDPTSNLITLIDRSQWKKPQNGGVVNQVHQGSESGAPGVVNQVHRGSESGAPEQKETEQKETEQKEINNGASPAAKAVSFLSDLPEGERLLSLLVEYDSSKTETEWTESRFPNLVLQRKYQAAAAVLGPRLEEGIIAGLSKPGIPLSGLINYLCGYTPPVDLGNDDLYPVDQTEQAGGVDSLKASLARKYSLTPQLLRVERAGKSYRVSVLNPLSKNGRAARASIVEVESIEIDQAPPPEEIGPPPSDDWTEEAWRHWHERGRPARPRGMADSTFAGLMQREVETEKSL